MHIKLFKIFIKKVLTLIEIQGIIILQGKEETKKEKQLDN